MKKILEKWKALNITVKLLCGFFVVAMIMTVISQINYNNNLTVVRVLHSTDKAISHTAQYAAEATDSYSCNWTMEEEGEFLELDDEITIHCVTISSKRNVKEVLKPYYETVKSVKGSITDVYYDEIDKLYHVSAASQETILEENVDLVIAEVNYTGNRRSYVIPYDSIIQAKSMNESSAVFIIEEISKVWGTEYRLVRKPIDIIETNGVEAAINSDISSYIVEDAANMNLYAGQAVKITQ